MKVNPPVASGTTAETVLQIQDRRLLLAARLVWILLFSLVLLVIIIVIPPWYQQVYERSQTVSWLRTGLLQLGISPQFRTACIMGSKMLAALAYLPGAFLIFYLRSDNWMAWLVSLALLMFSITLNAILNRLPIIYPELTWIAVVLYYFAFLVGLSFFFLFPDGRFVFSWTKRLFIPYFAWEIFRVYYGLVVTRNSDVLSAPIWNLPLIAMIIIGLGTIVYRYRRSSPTQQQQVNYTPPKRWWRCKGD